jgi:hypothetical protein
MKLFYHESNTSKYMPNILTPHATFVVIGTDHIGRYRSNNHMITAMTAPTKVKENELKYN